MTKQCSEKQIQQFIQMIDEIRKEKKIKFVRTNGKSDDYAKLYKQMLIRSMNEK